MKRKQTARREFLGLLGTGATWGLLGDLPTSAAPPSPPSPASTSTGAATPPREDGRFIKTGSFLHKYLATMEPKLAFRPDMTAKQMPAWQKAVREKLLELMCFPEVPAQPKPARIWSKPRDGYRLERWEAYPEPYSVVPYYMLIPDGASPQSPAPAVMCFPGSNGSKELLAGEPQLPGCPAMDKTKWSDNRMAYHYARRGLVAVAVDTPDTNELGDGGMWPRENLSIAAIWMGRSYESISVFQKACILRWLIEQPYVDAKRVATSGHSLGAKPADILGILFPEVVKAIVHNDFVCHWQERAVAVKLHCSAMQTVPGLLSWFDYTDLEAALAPCPLLFTEGGRPQQIAKIRRAYALKQAPDAVRVHHYEKYEDPVSRTLDDAVLPTGITMEQYFAYAYVDAPLHRFRPNRAVPWLADVFHMQK